MNELKKILEIKQKVDLEDLLYKTWKKIGCLIFENTRLFIPLY